MYTELFVMEIDAAWGPEVMIAARFSPRQKSCATSGITHLQYLPNNDFQTVETAGGVPGEKLGQSAAPNLRGISTISPPDAYLMRL